MCFHHNHKNDPNILKMYQLNKHSNIKTKSGKRSIVKSMPPKLCS